MSHRRISLLLSSLAHFYARLIARPRVTPTLRVLVRLPQFSNAHLLSLSGVWLLILYILAVLPLVDTAWWPQRSRSTAAGEVVNSMLPVCGASGRVGLIDSPALLIAATASHTCFEWLRARRLRRVWRMGVAREEKESGWQLTLNQKPRSLRIGLLLHPVFLQNAHLCQQSYNSRDAPPHFSSCLEVLNNADPISLIHSSEDKLSEKCLQLI